ncbi:MAG: hypothetical protein LBV23_00555 [Deltaproteobacteria bacterium]|nr:hypothetical protein [Deltaproteobacteria bacterium]
MRIVSSNTAESVLIETATYGGHPPSHLAKELKGEDGRYVVIEGKMFGR